MTIRDYLAAQGVLDRCRDAEILLNATADGLAFDAPPETVAEFLEDLRIHKPAILELLQGDWPAWALEDTVVPDELPTCETCGELCTRWDASDRPTCPRCNWTGAAAERLRKHASKLRARRASQ